jgi:hypothetical protein
MTLNTSASTLKNLEGLRHHHGAHAHPPIYISSLPLLPIHRSGAPRASHPSLLSSTPPRSLFRATLGGGTEKGRAAGAGVQHLGHWQGQRQRRAASSRVYACTRGCTRGTQAVPTGFHRTACVFVYVHAYQYLDNICIHTYYIHAYTHSYI